MKKVTSINRGKFLGAYCDDARNERIPEQILFAAGVLLLVGLPQFIFGIYGGVAPIIAFAGSSSVGFIWGLLRYARVPDQLSIADTGFAAQSPPRKDGKMKDAA